MPVEREAEGTCSRLDPSRAERRWSSVRPGPLLREDQPPGAADTDHRAYCSGSIVPPSVWELCLLSEPEALLNSVGVRSGSVLRSSGQRPLSLGAPQPGGPSAWRPPAWRPRGLGAPQPGGPSAWRPLSLGAPQPGALVRGPSAWGPSAWRPLSLGAPQPGAPQPGGPSAWGPSAWGPSAWGPLSLEAPQPGGPSAWGPLSLGAPQPGALLQLSLSGAPSPGAGRVVGLEVSTGKVSLLQATNGSTVLLPCTYSSCIGIHKLYFNWHYNDNGTMLKLCEAVIPRENVEPVVGVYHERVEFVGSSRRNNISILLWNITFEDRGDYVCFARNPKEKNRNHSAVYTLIVVDQLTEVDTTLTTAMVAVVGTLLGSLLLFMVAKALVVNFMPKKEDKNKDCLVSSTVVDHSEDGRSGPKGSKGKA
ncbi:unnamed protein product [Arctogadus glacialis]